LVVEDPQFCLCKVKKTVDFGLLPMPRLPTQGKRRRRGKRKKRRRRGVYSD